MCFNDVLKSLFLLSLVFWISCKDKKASKDDGDSDDAVLQEVVSPNSSTQKTEDNLYADIDISPMDMSYYPPKYPQQKITGAAEGPPVMRIIYSRPHLEGRHLFKDILQYERPWRLGANEATELEVFQPVAIGDQKIPAGRYSLYAIPRAGYWTIAVNKDLDLWGLKQDSTLDVTRVRVPVTYYNPTMEYFTMAFEKAATGANLIIGWDDVRAKLPIKF